jgi:hypothetical protein
MQPEEARALTQGLHRLRTPNRRKPEYAIADVEQQIRDQIVTAMRPLRMEMSLELTGCSDPRNDLSDVVRNMLDNLRLQLPPQEIICSTDDCYDFHNYKYVPEIMGIVYDAILLLRQKVSHDFKRIDIKDLAKNAIRDLHTEEEGRDCSMSIAFANRVFHAAEVN